MIDWIEGDMLTSYSYDSVDIDDEGDHINEELLNRLEPTGFPPHCLQLKRKTVVILIRNVDSQQGLCNGTRCLVLGMETEVMKLRVLTGVSAGTEVFIPKMTMTPTDHKTGISFKRRQFPVIPAFCMTINKSQGQSFDHVGIDLTQNVFGHGQLYVALSRCRESRNLKIQVGPRKRLRGCAFAPCLVKNIVYEQVLQKDGE